MIVMLFDVFWWFVRFDHSWFKLMLKNSNKLSCSMVLKMFDDFLWFLKIFHDFFGIR
jgi:hypothetical protein